MIAAQVIGNDATITLAGQSGQLPAERHVAGDRLQPAAESRRCSAIACRNLADHALAGLHRESRRDSRDALARNPILVTALNPVIGYERGAAIAKKAYAEGRPIQDVAREMTDLGADELARLLDPRALTEGGIKGEAT